MSEKEVAYRDWVTAAIEKALKDMGASVKLHAITPEVDYTNKVTLKPVDGAANHVGDKVEIGETVTGEVKGSWSGRLAFPLTYGAWGTFWEVCADIALTDLSLVSYDHTVNEFDAYVNTVVFTVPADVDVYAGPRDESLPKQNVGMIPKGSTCTFTFWHNKPFSPETGTSWLVNGIYFDGIELGNFLYSGGGPDGDVTDMPVPLDSYTRDSGDKLNLSTSYLSREKDFAIAIPESADASKARKFSLAVETDTETEKAVEWQGGEVIEAVPGVSRLVPGLNVWDVAEVAPGKFKVERASSPAQSAPLILTAPNGRVAELTVGDDLVLEVKEI